MNEMKEKVKVPQAVVAHCVYIYDIDDDDGMMPCWHRFPI